MLNRPLNRFAIMLDIAIAGSGSKVCDILQAIDETPTYKKTEAIQQWRLGRASPRKGQYIRILRKIESHLGLPEGRLANSVMDKRGGPELDVHSFYFYWKDMIHRYGIYNPYTKRGAIKGLLPHGPHCVRDVLATQLLKTTGSYELASFAIQDSLESVMRHYARFLPHEIIARAAEELNKVWRR